MASRASARFQSRDHEVEEGSRWGVFRLGERRLQVAFKNTASR